MVFPTRQTAVLKGHIGAVHCVTYSAGLGTYALSGGADRKINLWNPSKGTKVQTYSAHGYEVLSIACSHDNALLASSGGDKLVFLWDVSTATTLRRLEGHWGRINTVEFNADASILVSGSYDATVRFWDIKSQNRKPVQTLEDAKDSISDVSIRAHEVIAGSVDGRIRNYDLRMGKCYVDTIAPAGVTSVKQSADGAATLVGALDGMVRLMDKTDGKMLQNYKGHKNTEYRVKSCFAEKEELVVSGSEDGTIWCWDLVEGGKRQVLSGHGGKVVTGVDYCPGGKSQMVTGGSDGTVVVWGE
ncbi:WD40-repeat-containing domain protein [Geopyxis carbonaria]|nr:WD40-repeat-containing domain protein [Geopyxis carbonaria]